MKIRHLIAWCVAALTLLPVYGARKTVLEPSYAWTAEPPLGAHQPSTIDTLFHDYSLRFVPQLISPVYATTGNYCAEGRSMMATTLPMTPGDFWFHDAVAHWLPSQAKTKFYNTRIPMTLLSYNFGGGKQDGQDRFTTIFSANANARTQVGAMVDYLYSKGSYDYQAAKDLTWGFSGSYIGERVEFQGYYFHYNLVTKENGGIIDDAYITDPASVQGGNTSINCKDIPTNLTAAHNRVRGGELYLNTRYKMGFWKHEQINDSVTKSTLVPVTSLIWTLKFSNGQHRFRNDNAQQNIEFWPNTYLAPGFTNDYQTYWKLRNTFGIALLEGFNRYAKAGGALFLTHEIRRYDLQSEATPGVEGTLTPIPCDPRLKQTQNGLWAGAQITRRAGRILNYDATGQIGFLGHAAGEIKAEGNIYTNIPIRNDSLRIKAFASFHNLTAPWLSEHYYSNHFMWENDFGKIRDLRFGGGIDFDRTHTSIRVEAGNLQNAIFFTSEGLPRQYGGSVQTFSATLNQGLHVRAFHWDNSITYQTSSDQLVAPMPALAVTSNMYVTFRVATLNVQLGVNCDYFTRYYAPQFQPATMTFSHQTAVKLGNYPLMTAYINCKLSKTRFYVMMSHLNQGLTGSNYFSMPGYPMNPRRLLMGLSIDFAN